MDDAFDRRHLATPRNRFLQKGSMAQAQFEMEETLDAYEIKIDLSGLDKKNIKIAVNAHSVTISGEHVQQQEQLWANGSIRSSHSGLFMQTIPLPVDADTTNVEQIEEGSLLIIKVPKKK
jgi:HSP20 family protein